MTHIGQQVAFTIDDRPVLAFVTAIDDKRKDKDDPNATFVDLAVFPAGEQMRAIDGVRLYDGTEDYDNAREAGLGHVAHAQDDDAAAKPKTGRASKAKTETTPPDPSGANPPVTVP